MADRADVLRRPWRWQAAVGRRWRRRCLRPRAGTGCRERAGRRGGYHRRILRRRERSRDDLPEVGRAALQRSGPGVCRGRIVVELCGDIRDLRHVGRRRTEVDVVARREHGTIPDERRRRRHSGRA